jgi:hypothetical protein
MSHGGPSRALRGKDTGYQKLSTWNVAARSM